MPGEYRGCGHVLDHDAEVRDEIRDLHFMFLGLWFARIGARADELDRLRLGFGRTRADV